MSKLRLLPVIKEKPEPIAFVSECKEFIYVRKVGTSNMFNRLYLDRGGFCTAGDLIWTLNELVNDGRLTPLYEGQKIEITL